MSQPRVHADATSANTPPPEFTLGGVRYKKVPYAPPEPGFLYTVRDKSHAERIICVKNTDGAHVEVETLTDGNPSKRPIQLTIESLTRQAAKGWCTRLVPLDETEPATPGAASSSPAPSPEPPAPSPRLDIQNFGRCCGDIARANIRFSTQLIKDVGDGPFRAGDYQQAFVTFEQIAVGFTSAVAASRRAIADGRRALSAAKTTLSGKEIQERTAAFIKSEQQITAAERSFAAILEGLRMYIITQQD